MTVINDIYSFIFKKDYSSALYLLEKAENEKTISHYNLEIFKSSRWYLEEKAKPNFFKSNGESVNKSFLISDDTNNTYNLSIHYCVMLMADEIEVTKITLASVIEQMSEHDSAFILLNGFTDKALITRLRQHTSVYCFSSEANLGVAGGRNYLYSRIFEANKNPDYIVNLDNDVAIPQDFCFNVRDIATRTYNNDNIGIIGAVILDHKKELVKNFIDTKSIKYQSYLNAVICGFYTDDLRQYIKSRKENLYWHCGMHSDYQSVYLDQLATTKFISDPLFLASNSKLDFSANDNWIEISNAAGCFQLFKANLLKRFGFLNEKYSPYFWEDSEFSCRLIKNGFKNYTSTAILLCHGTDNRHKSRKMGDEILRLCTNEYRARAIFESDIAKSKLKSIYNNLTSRVRLNANNQKDKSKALAMQIGIYKGLAQLGYLPGDLNNHSDTLVNKLVSFEKLEEAYRSKPKTPELQDTISNSSKPTVVEMSEDLKVFFNIHHDEECILLCNGPSLKKTDLGFLKALDIPIFASNSSYILANKLDFMPTYFVCEDNHVIDDNREEIINLSRCHKFVPDKYFEKLGSHDKLHYLPTNWDAYFKSRSSYQNPEFSEDISKNIYVGQTVTYLMLQIAFYMGFKSIYIVGLDFSYRIPKGSDINGNSIDHVDDDPNHFHKDYFGKGKQWHFPKLDSCLQSYIKANKKFLDANKIIHNCTINTKLNAFRISNHINGTHVRSSLDTNTELPTYLDQYFNYSLHHGQCIDKWSLSELKQHWEVFVSNSTFIYYAANNSFHQIDTYSDLSAFPFLTDFDSTSNVAYVYLNLSDDLLNLDYQMYGKNKLYAFFFDLDQYNAEIIQSLLTDLKSVWNNFCVIKSDKKIYLKQIMC